MQEERELPPGQEPTQVVRVPDDGPAPLPDTPMKEGEQPGQVPAWLTKHCAGMPDKRAAMKITDQVYFDSLWRRATGVERPALSGRERDVLISYLDKGADDDESKRY